MLLVEGGAFDMGDAGIFSYLRELPIHKVKLSSFYLAQYPVTQVLWQAVMADEPAHFKGDNRPAERISWEDAQKFIGKLYLKTGVPFRLPTEAEWEFAARGGMYNNGLEYTGSNRLKEVAWFSTNSHRETKPVGWRYRNELGLFDLIGNVWEWCEDDWHDDYKMAPDDGSAWIDQPERNIHRVGRCSSWGSIPRHSRTANRNYWLPTDRDLNLGFRLALSLQLTDRPDGYL
ncbi:MAG: formylglycine-generating enzyme family protein [Saprospiraceae bacterium]